MENTTSMGTNRTGLQTSGDNKDTMIEFAEANASNAPVEQGEFMAMHRAMIDEAEPVGSVPVPATVKGMAKTGMSKLAGNKPEVLVDKLGERLAFERSGTRLYDALIMKCTAMQNGSAAPGGIDLATLEHFRDEEEAHFHLVSDALVELGADPTAVTPCADVVGVMSMGLVKTVSDPRTTLPQSLSAILTAELTDNAGWELLIELAQGLGHDDMATRFEEALQAEQTHLATIRDWVREGVLTEAT
jgi:hypothetical protein